MSTSMSDPVGDIHYRKILGVRFFVGDALQAVEIGASGGLVVVPAAPALVELERDKDYRDALTGADLVITDSGLLVIVWNLLKWDRIHRVSGLEYLQLLLQRPEFRRPGSTLWVMPSRQSMNRNVSWLTAQGYAVGEDDCYLAPRYAPGPISDPALLKKVQETRPEHIIVCVGGGVQERLGFFLKRGCGYRPAIHCIGAAIGFLSGDQVRIPAWADQLVLGWLFRCLSQPIRFVPRYFRALQLPVALWRYAQRKVE